ncbi:hypothetical protein ABEB36_004599 [Hypothenemus hampei]|uniref:Cytochrome c oxidase subunit 7C, mitochondrial n=1 Tax=Hypothenemus hampei TaxID=57062 RepID=A0ABD1F5E5_HYPHA
MIRRTSWFVRQTITNLVRNSHLNGGIPGENLPFSIRNRYKLTALFILFYGSGSSAPFFILRYHLLKD